MKVTCGCASVIGPLMAKFCSFFLDKNLNFCEKIVSLSAGDFNLKMMSDSWDLSSKATLLSFSFLKVWPV